MDINDLGKLRENKQPFSVRIVRDINWRHTVETCVYISVPVAPRGETPIEVTFDFKHPALFSLITTKNLFDSHGISYELDDRLAVSGSKSPDAEPASPVSQNRRSCKTCGKRSFKTSRNCLNPHPNTHGQHRWTCLLEPGNWREPADRFDFIQGVSS
jgi:hypothetical protein